MTAHRRLLTSAAALALCAACTASPTPPSEPPSEPPAEVPPVDKPQAEPPAADRCDTLEPIYPSKGVHNPCGCGDDGCIEARSPSDPPDPTYPPTWVSEWTMYRVFANYEDNLPPWSSPPAGLTEGKDYEVSTGATYYDDTYRDERGQGAMMEHYDKRCLPIFPIENTFTCSFVSLGDTAYFLTYEQDRPADMPPCCLFSPYNHPPRPDFIKHLPYSQVDSTHVDGRLQAYRYVAQPHNIWFAYAFYKDAWLDEDKAYLRPQSFYFSGVPTSPPNAPFVSQNYTNFRIEKPDPAATWDQVAQMCPADPPPCALFDPPEHPTADWTSIDFSKPPKEAAR